MAGFWIDIVERVPLATRVTPENVRYLRTKRERMGHLLDGFEGIAAETDNAEQTDGRADLAQS